MTMTANHALHLTAASRRCCNRRAPWPPSLNLGAERPTPMFGLLDVLT